jgi:hypothetical protein
MLDFIFNFNIIDLLPVVSDAVAQNTPFGADMSIEGLRSQKFSVGIFYFLIIGILVFSGIAGAFIFKDKTKKMKKGEMILFGWIFLGVIVAVIFGAVQLLQGYLF